MTTYKKRLIDKNGNTIYPDVGLNLDDVVYSDDPTTSVQDMVDPYTYSTDETRIGTWIDGKPIYRKVFDITNPSTSNTDYSLISSDLETCIKIYGFMAISDGTQIPVPQTDSSSTYSVIFMKSDKKLRGRFSYAGAVPSGVKIIVEYTKTTD